MNARQRCLDEARYYIANDVTIRQTAVEFNVSKSTVFTDLKYKLNKYNKELYANAESRRLHNKNERHLRRWRCNKS